MMIRGMTMFSFSPGSKLVLASTTDMAAATEMQIRTTPRNCSPDQAYAPGCIFHFSGHSNSPAIFAIHVGQLKTICRGAFNRTVIAPHPHLRYPHLRFLSGDFLARAS